jgi:hypothetical protein
MMMTVVVGVVVEVVVVCARALLRSEQARCVEAAVLATATALTTE